MTERGLSRRRLIGIATVATGGAIGALALPRWRLAVPAEEVVWALARQVANPRLDLLGRLYLLEHPGEADPELLAREVLAGLPWEQGTLDALGAAFAARLQADFEAGEVVSLGGWMVARSEARLCALVALGSAPA